MKFILQYVFLTCLIILTGCASIVSKSQYPVSINSSPTNAKVTVINDRGMEMHKATTPTMVTLSAKRGYFRSASYTFKFEKDGYHPSTTSLSAGLDGWYIGNILFGGLIGFLGVDPGTGAMWKLEDTVYGSLTAITSDINNSEEPRDN